MANATRKTAAAKPAAEEKATTTLDSDVTKPSTTAPGDGPADTTDPTEEASTVGGDKKAAAEEASTVGGDKKAAAEEGHLTVNAVVPVEPVNKRARSSSKRKDRIEEYEAVRPDGSTVKVTHNIDTGETSVS